MRNPAEFVQLIDRYRLGESRRLAIGVAIDAGLEQATASLALCEGRGKCLRLRWVESCLTPIPDSVREAGLRLIRGSSNGIDELAAVRNDLALVVVAAVRQAILISGGNEKKLLGVCIDDPGIWLRDFDGAATWEPLVAAVPVAEQTGLSVVDGLPLRDLAGAGMGWPLGPLAWWLMFADRRTPVADTGRILVRWKNRCEFAWLPESDGLDNEFPEIRTATLPGTDFEAAFLERCGRPGLEPSERDRLGAQGRVDVALARFWLDHFSAEWSRAHPANPEMERALVERSIAMMNSQPLPVHDVIRTFSHCIAHELGRFAEKFSRRNPNVGLVGGGDLAGHGLLVSEITRQTGMPWCDFSEINWTAAALDAATAGVLGLLHFDQMPVTVPWLTGTGLPRVAGRLTPGNPASFRRLIMEMGDARPPVMKLREAV
jgi:1,6-anhydro-N-acetylmuramate kinase